MVQVIENRTAIRARVVSVAPHPTLADHAQVELAIAETEPVSGFANLFAEAAGQTVKVNVAANDASTLSAGDVVSARIRRTGPAAVFADSGSIAVVRGT